MKPTIDIVNVVATSPVCGDVDLDRVCTRLDCTYHPDNFPGLTIRLAEPKCAVLLFKTGKTVCTGTKSPDMAAVALKKVAVLLRSIGVDADENPKVTITNMVAMGVFGRRVHLETAPRKLPRSMYEPELFPGIVCRMVDPKCVILLFASGKIVCVGARSEADITRAVNQMAATLEMKGLFADSTPESAVMV